MGRLLFLCITFFVVYSSQEKVKVTIYYESLCPASQEFIKKQFYPAYHILGDDAIIVEMFPYSEVRKFNDNWYVYCQHGDIECFANKGQVCVLGQNVTQKQSTDFIGCLMSTDHPQKKVFMRKCAQQNEISWKNIKQCLNSEEGNILMAAVYNDTIKIRPKLKYVPHIIFNDVFNRTLEISARLNFLSTICHMYIDKPFGCLSK